MNWFQQAADHARRVKRWWYFVGLAVMLVAGCAPTMQTGPTDRETLFQASTLSSLNEGIYAEAMTIGELKQYGDFGVGTFEALDGEMVFVDGVVYRVDAQGVVHVADDAITTPFAVATYFDAEETTPLHESFTCAQLQSYLDERLPSQNVPYALKVDGTFTALTVRSVAAQQEPYPPLADALAQQVLFDKQDISGTLVGFRTPDYLAGANAAGYHFHFLSHDKQVGGHVLDCTTGAVTVAVDDIARVAMYLPQNEAFRAAPAKAMTTDAETTPLVVFGAYGTSIDEPWNQAIHRALLDAQAAGDITYTFVDEIGYDGDIDAVLRRAIAESAPAIIVGDAFGNEEAVTVVAQDHPEIAFVFGSDQEPDAPNLSVFDSWTREPAYLAGMLAGGMTQSDVVGVVAGYAEGSVSQAVDAFAAGVAAVNPAAEVRVEFINSWFDPQAAGAAAQGLIDGGADVLFGERTGVIEVAADAQIYAIGNMIDQVDVAPDVVLSSVVWDMRPTFDYIIDQVRRGTYTGQDLADFTTLAVGGAKLAPLNRAVMRGIPDDLVARIVATAEAIAAGQIVIPVDAPTVTAPAPIVLGALYNLTGAQAGLDIPSSRGAQLAVEEANRAGGILGRPVQLALADGETDPAVLAAQTTDLLAQYPDVVAFLGLSDTDMVLASAPVAAAAQRLFLTSGATSPDLPAQVPDYLFLACFGDNVQAAAAAEWAYDTVGARTVAVLYDTGMLYTQGLQEYFTAHFTALGGEVIATATYTSGDRAGLSQAVDSLAQADVIFVAAGPEDAPEAARDLRAAGFTAPILGGDGFDSGALWQQYPDVGDVYFTTHAYLGADNPSPTVQTFRDLFLARYPDAAPDAFAALGYDAVNLLLTAVANAASTEPEAVRAALADIEGFDGVTGQITFATDNPIPRKSVTILSVNAGTYGYVTELLPASVPSPGD